LSERDSSTEGIYGKFRVVHQQWDANLSFERVDPCTFFLFDVQMQ